jgi:hypothetical protein
MLVPDARRLAKAVERLEKLADELLSVFVIPREALRIIMYTSLSMKP